VDTTLRSTFISLPGDRMWADFLKAVRQTPALICIFEEKHRSATRGV
jgi:hypothetical protein